jgi:hypothetical protein
MSARLLKLTESLREFQKDFRRDAPGRAAPRGREPMAGRGIPIIELVCG